MENETNVGGVHATWSRCLTALVAIAALGVSLIYADIDITFNSLLDAVNEQSDGSSLNTSFTFELGSFESGFTPTIANTSQWLDRWEAVPGSSSAGYSQTPLPPVIAPDTGASNNFSGSVTLTSNASPFATTDQAYIWGYDDRGDSGTGEWILITNPGWTYPLVTAGVQLGGPDFSTTAAGTIAVIGDINPSFSSLGDDPHLVTESVLLAPAVPEPSVALLLVGGFGMMLMRRRR